MAPERLGLLMVTLTAAGSMLLACGSGHAKDENELRALVASQDHALKDYDVDLAVELVCPEYQEDKRASMEKLLPKMTDFVTPEQRSDPQYMANLKDILFQKYGGLGLYIETADNVAETLRRQDPVAFGKAAQEFVVDMIDVQRSDVRNIDVDGDTATADVKRAYAIGKNEPGVTTDTQMIFVRNGLGWLDCTPPAR
ncbi:hypothetical protein A5784_28100 [Mycobacterium sp. 852013-50091_SCH5140682]|uniref:hypothetical protein n=1 Tax=Mycobacterium sp. 852013-50091_SCH5140682 TaxID=1834109 RepID=UPI0007EA2D8F|nr:hypothetical protein [Mycobacterium sp. 852013-50091_SCH5140682]OBC15957.1 hypothetical protein A5784_28100 [Mycobacterium sp. 852013-50091_SCH5140682]